MERSADLLRRAISSVTSSVVRSLPCVRTCTWGHATGDVFALRTFPGSRAVP